jgi:NADH dehydrogenase (ubiquinone) Fe-S protein 5
VLEDYYEYAHLSTSAHPFLTTGYRCLHHRKEAAKIMALQHAYRKREAETSRDNAPSAGQIRSLGLLDKNAEETDVKKGGVLPTLEDNQPRPAGQKPIVH